MTPGKQHKGTVQELVSERLRAGLRTDFWALKAYNQSPKANDKKNSIMQIQAFKNHESAPSTLKTMRFKNNKFAF